MTRCMTIVTSLALLGLMTTAAMAASDTQDVTCTVTALSDSIVVPAALSLTAARRATDESASLTVKYGFDATEGTKKITVAAAVGSGTPVAAAKLSIQGGGLGTEGWTELITAETPVTPAPTLVSELAAANPETVAADDVKLQLDATGVAASADNLGTSWEYQLTYTLTD